MYKLNVFTGTFDLVNKVSSFPGSGQAYGNGTLEVIGGYVLNEDGTYALNEDDSRIPIESGISYQLNEDGTYALGEDGYRIVLEGGPSYVLNEDGTYALNEDGTRVLAENSSIPIPGVATQLSRTSVPASMIWITPKSYNTETIWIFDSTVTVGGGIPIYVGASGQFFPIADLSDLWIIGNITEGIDYYYMYTPAASTDGLQFGGSDLEFGGSGLRFNP